MRLLWILLSTNKCNGVPFTDISEWKRHSSSSGSTDSSHWIVLFTTVAVRYTSMMCLFSIFYGWDSQSEFASMALTLTTNDYFDRHSSVLFQGILLVTPLPSVILHLTFTLSVLCLVLFVRRLFVTVVFIILWLLQIRTPEFPFILVTKVFLNFDNISIGNSQWWDV